MRAVYADAAGHLERDGIRLGYEIYGEGEPTLLLLPTWTIIHTRFWKMQIPYLARHYRVITYDGPGNGLSDRVLDPARYTADAYAADALAVLDECRTDSAVVAGLSLGGQYGVALATMAPERVSGLIMIGPALPITPPSPERSAIDGQFLEPYPDDVSGWGKYNLAYWHDHYSDFVQYFFSQCFSEPHSTKPIEDSVGWALETDSHVLGAQSTHPGPEPDWAMKLAALACPTLVIHGTHDRIQPHERGAEAARLSGGTILSMEGSGHIPNVRDPVKVNLAIRDFVERLPT
jgi:pimeloyl-ACP methyl ester carboxylesterase